MDNGGRVREGEKGGSRRADLSRGSDSTVHSAANKIR